MKRFEGKKIILLIFLLIAVFSFSGMNLVYAQLTPAEQRAALEAEHGDVPINADAGAGGGGGATTNAQKIKDMNPIIYGATFVAEKILSLFASLISFAIALGRDITTLPVVTSGFQVMLLFANLGFVLAIIVMAFAVIFQFQSYGAKQLLARLIIAALLVNFSAVIAGAFISVANQFTDYFLEPFKGGLGSALADALNPQKLAQVTETKDISAWDVVWNGLSGALQLFASLIFVLVFTLLTVVVFIAIFVMFLIRDVYLAILIILMPLVWLLWIFPATRQYWKLWWGQFLRWVFFAPIMLFFIYIVVSAAPKMGSIKAFESVRGVDSSQALEAGLTLGKGFVLYVAQLIIMIALLIGGMMVANKLGIVGASTVYGMAQGAGKGIRGWVGGKAKQAGGSAWDRFRTSGKKEETPGQVTTRLQRAGSSLQRVPLLRGVGSFIAKQGVISKDESKKVEEYRKSQLASLNNTGVISRATSVTAFLDPRSAAAIGQELAQRNLTNDPRIAPLMERFVNVAERMGNVQEIYNNRPDLAIQRPSEPTRADAIFRAVKGISTADIVQVAHQSVGVWDNAAARPSNEQIDVALNLSNSQLGKLSSEGKAQQQEAVRNTMRQIRDQHAVGTLTLSATQQASLQRILDHILNNPNWQNI